MTAAEEKVLYERTGPIAEIVLNRPDKLNALDWECLDLLENSIDRADRDDQVRAIVVSGRGRCFSAGADLGMVEKLAKDSDKFSLFLQRWHQVFSTVERSAKVTIAAVHGFAFAGGFELTQVCDLLIMGRKALLGDQHANYGLFPGGGSTQRLPRLTSRRQALWMLLSGEAVDADTAYSIGLVNQVADDADVLDVAHDKAFMLAERSISASHAIKEAVRRGGPLDIDSALTVERQIAVEHMASRDAEIGLKAFRERTTPNFGFHR